MTVIGDHPRLRYREGCLAAHALNVIGDRWALLVTRELMLKPKRFQAIRAGLPGITAGVLTQRLNQLADAGVLEHDPDLGTYALTASGRALLPVLIALCRWGSQHPGHDPARFISPTALMLSMTANIDRATAAARPLVAGIVSGRETFTLRPDARGDLEVTPALQHGRDFTLTGTGNELARAVYGPRSLAALLAEGLIAIDGDIAAAQAFADLFHLRPTSR